ncbi:PREDICTED: cell division control protein 45 homolog [Tarenaya hassleriana]|uniref:cell division control protein 45 homolog n=1 Tax=Tarenaya hassleriana TaxID=28532 RepID=UPI00053CA6E5|nr:PREDICTED: cell division control protein 45 homolog [Tarenaya hassleriana]
MVRVQKVESFYSRLRESATSSSQSPLLIFPSASDVDSLCALKIITHVLESDSVQYSCFPVSSFLEIHKYAGPGLCSSSDNPITILLINWGCHRDLRAALQLGPAARVFVVDSHRPIHLHNLSDRNDQVVVLHTDDDEQQADLAYDFDVLTLANESFQLHLDGEEDESDDEYESGSDRDAEDEEEDGHKSGSDDEDGDGNRSSKRRRVSDNVKVFKKLKRDYYWMGTFHGKPSGCLMFELSHLLRKNTNELLWLACVSLSDQFVHERLTDERYQAGVMELEQHINSSGNIDKVTSVTLKDGTKIRAPDCSRISYEEEPRLMLLREWTLFDSMLCSSYIATKLKTWSDNGIKKLKLLLARMGFALIDCQQKFPYMSHEVKKKMKEEFDRFLPEYGLTDFYYRSFLRLHGYSSRVSAADVVYGVTALLESFVGSDGSSSASKQFGQAYDALSLNNVDKLKSGMQQAIRVQRAILRQGSTAITKSGCIRSGRKFRWVKVEDSLDSKYLGYPQALTKFCYFLMDALREKGARMKPMLCACTSQQPGKILIVGVCGKPRLGAVKGNGFGNAFRNAAQETGADYFHELFESSWIVLDEVGVNSFMIRLTEKL